MYMLHVFSVCYALTNIIWNHDLFQEEEESEFEESDGESDFNPFGSDSGMLLINKHFYTTFLNW